MLDPFLLAALAVAFIGTAYASWSDLKTTEVSDWVPAMMAGAGLLIHGLHSLLAWDYTFILSSLGLGVAYLLFGVLMYKTGQWGGADAAILAALGFLLPAFPGFTFYGLAIPYQIGFVLNLFIVGAAYSFVYALVLAFRNQKVFTLFLRDITNTWKRLTAYFIAISAVVMLSSLTISYVLADLSMFMQAFMQQAFMLPLFIFLLLYWRFAKVIETNVFKWKIPTKDLKEGDMVAEDVELPKETIRAKFLEGLTKRQVAQIRRHKRFITIKEGVRFIPAFLLNLILTLMLSYYGS